MQTSLQLYQFNEETMPIVESVCFHLLKPFGITHFGHIKFNNNGQMLRLANNKQWNEIYYKEEFYNDNKIYDLSWVPLGERRKRFLTGEPSTPHEKNLFENNLWNFLLIYERTENEGGFTFFGTERNNTNVVDYYLNYPEAFDHFLIYFKEKAFPFLEMKKDRCIQLDITPMEGDSSNRDMAKNFYKDTEVSKFHLGTNLTLSKREAETLRYILRGKSVKRIAKILNLSPRTVESYVNSIKIKTNTKSKEELIDKFINVMSDLN